MTDRLKKKLRSSKGASITFALLLFLVCAVIGSVVLAAGTASSGRFSKLAESDARYYSVTSAAALLKDEINGRSFKKVYTETERYTEDIDPHGTPVAGTKSVIFPTEGEDKGTTEYLGFGGYEYKPDNPPSTIDRLLYQAVLNYGESSDIEYDYQLNLDPAPETSSASQSVAVKETVSTNGSVTFTISNGGTSEIFTVEVVFDVDVTENVSFSTVENGITVSASNSENKTVDKTVTKTTETSFEWTLSDIRRIAG